MVGMRETEEVDRSRMDGLSVHRVLWRVEHQQSTKPLQVAPESGGQLQSVYCGPFGDDRCHHEIPQTSWDTGGAGRWALPYPHLAEEPAVTAPQALHEDFSLFPLAPCFPSRLNV